jgi:hypothetical protein
MSKNNQYKRIRPEESLRYISGEMSDRERHEFERLLQRDLFASDAVEGLSTSDTKELREDLKKLKGRLDRRTGKRNSVVWIRIAASVAAVVVLGTLYFTVFSDRLGRMDGVVTKSETAEPEREEAMPQEQAAPYGGPAEKEAEPDQVAGGPGEENRRVSTEPAGPRNQPKTSEAVIRADEESRMAETSVEGRLMDTELQVADQEIAAGRMSETADTSASRLIAPPPVPLSNLASTASLEAEDTEETAGSQQVYMEVPTESETSATRAAKSAAQPGISEGLQERQLEKRAPVVRPSAVMIPDSIPAMPAGGWEAFNRYIEINMRVPQGDSLSLPASVRLHFSLDPQGHPRDIKVDSSPSEPFSTEAVRLLQGGPSWNPPVRNGAPSIGPIPLRIEFRRR